MTTTFTELDHPRAGTGRFTDKEQTAPDFELLAGTPRHSVTITDAQDVTLTSFEDAYELGFPQYRHGERHGDVVATYTTFEQYHEADATTYEVTVGASGEPVEVDELRHFPVVQRVRQHFDLSDLPQRAPARSNGDRDVFVRGTQAATVAALRDDRFHLSLGASVAPGELVALSVEKDGGRIVRALIDPFGKVTTAAEYTEDRDGDLVWVTYRPGQLRSLQKSGPSV